MLSNRSDGKIETKVPGFDLITGGGLLKSSALLFMGDSDGRKEVLARQIAWNLLQEGAKVLYYTVDQSAEELRYDMASYDWHVESFEEAGKLRVVDIFSHAAEKMDASVNEKLNAEGFISTSFQEKLYDLSLIYKEGIRFLPLTPLPQSAPRIVVIDSLSPLLSTSAEEAFRLVHTLKFATRIARATGIGIVHRGVHDDRIEESLKSLADGIIEITRADKTFSQSSLLEIVSYSGEYKRGPFPIEIDSRGPRVIPIALPNMIRIDKSRADESIP